MVDVSGYRAQARERWSRRQGPAEKVRRWGDVVELEPLSAFDRRIVHNAIKDDPDIETHSVEVEERTKKSCCFVRDARPRVSARFGVRQSGAFSVRNIEQPTSNADVEIGNFSVRCWLFAKKRRAPTYRRGHWQMCIDDICVLRKGR